MRRFVRAIRRAVHRWVGGAATRDVDDEFAFHLEAETRYNVSRGMTEAEARRAATEAFGRSDRHRDEIRRIGRVPIVEPALRELRLALRTLGRSPVQTGASLVTLALGVGAGALVLSMLRGVTVSTLPVPHANEVVLVDRWLEDEGAERSLGLPAHDIVELQGGATTLDALGAAAQGSFVVSGVEGPGRVVGAAISPDMFDVAARAPAMGRVFDATELSALPRPVVVSWGIWEDRMGADPAAVGREILVDGGPARVVGVMPEGFVFPISAELWVPLDLQAVLATPRDQSPTFLAMGRLAAGRTASDVAAELESTRDPSGARATEAADGMHERVRVYSASVWSGEDFVRTFRILWIVALSFLAVAVFNVANLRFASFLARQGELSLRRSLGAARTALVRLLALESLVLAVLGGGLGFVLAVVVVDSIDAGVTVLDLPPWISLSPDRATAAFVAGTVVVVLPLIGVVPALRATSDVARSGRAGQRFGWGVRGLVLAQVAVSIALLFSAAIATRSLTDFRDRPLGFDPAGVQTARTLLPPRTYPAADDRLAILDALDAESRRAGLPAVAFASSLPPEGAARVPFRQEGESTDRPAMRAQRVIATASYFETLDVGVEYGRAFQRTDDVASPPVVIVNEAFARVWWGDPSDAIGRRLRLGDDPSDPLAEVVGVVRNLQHTPFDFEKFPTAYLPWRQRPTAAVAVLARTTNPGAIRAMLNAVDPELAVWEPRPMEQVVRESRLVGGVVAGLFGGLAALGTVLAAVGLHAVVTFWAATRAGEISVRLAIGASPGSVGRWIARQGAGLVVPGLVVGVVLAAGISRLFAAAFPEIEAFPVGDLAGIIVVLGATATLALAAPVARAARTSPARALREE